MVVDMSPSRTIAPATGRLGLLMPGMGAAYLSVTHGGSGPDRLVRVETPIAAPPALVFTGDASQVLALAGFALVATGALAAGTARRR